MERFFEIMTKSYKTFYNKIIQYVIKFTNYSLKTAPDSLDNFRKLLRLKTFCVYYSQNGHLEPA